METKHTSPLLTKIEKYMAKNEMAATKFGRDAMGDPKLVFDLREGRELRRATTQKIEDFLKA